MFENDTIRRVNQRENENIHGSRRRIIATRNFIISIDTRDFFQTV